jgi:CubicO group peptidase (beta-lactamase class C family)
MKAVLVATSRPGRGVPRRVVYGLVAVVSLGASVGTQQPRPAQVEQLDSIAGAGVRENRAVGIVAAVVQGRDTLLLKGYGHADFENKVPMTADTVIPIGSVTKQFTAAAILQLRDQGKLSLDDALTTWLPDFDTRGNKVTLRHLLGHTSGILGLTAMPEIRAMQPFRTTTTATRDDVYKVMSRYPFQFPTGTMQIYSNSGFWLLGLIIEKASGMTYEDYVEKKIFESLGMTRSMYCNNSENVPRRASAYAVKNGIFRRAPDVVHTIGNYAAGALCSTVEDLITWLQALHGGKALPPTSYTDMITPSRLDDGTPTRYGMGLTIAEDGHGLKYIGHDGGGFGFSSVANWYPDAHLAVVVLANSEPDTIAIEELAAAVLPVPRPPSPFTGDAAALVGTYKGLGPNGDLVVEITRTTEGIVVSSAGPWSGPLTWIDGWTFRRRSALAIFRRRTEKGPATELVFDTGGDRVILKRQ